MEEKKLKYYLNQDEYSNGKLEKTIVQTKKDFPNKEIKTNISINSYGVYEITFEFENKNTYFNRIRIWFRKKIRRKENNENNKLLEARNQILQSDRYEKYTGNNRYGNYESKGTFKPY